jgi:transcriptional regulator with XRE-family HTH domain
MKSPRIAAALAQAGYSQRTLARLTGMSEAYLSTLFRSGRPPSQATAEIISAALNCEPQSLFPAISPHKAKNTLLKRAKRQARMEKENDNA